MAFESRCVILGRHGQTVFNRDGLIMGRSDSPLTEKGIQTASLMANLLAKESVRAIFASPLGRAAHTAAIYSEKLGITVQFRDAIAELSCGSWEGRPRSEISSVAHTLRPDWDVTPPGGESCRDGETRVLPLIHELRSYKTSGTVLVVGHASIGRVFLKLWLGLEPKMAVRISFPHDTVYFLEQGKAPTRVTADGERSSGLLVEDV